VGGKLSVFYHPKQNVPQNDSFSPSAGKPSLLVDRIKRYPEVHILDNFEPISKDTLYLVHDPNHVDAILACEKANGFGNTLPDVAESLPWTNGSFVAAARFAVANQAAALSPTSGFHHAEYASAMAFCTFNGLALAAVILHDTTMAKRIGILDLDAHYGNGTVGILHRLGVDYVEHYTYGRTVHLSASQFLEELHAVLTDQFSRVDVILYQAGADPHVDDPLGGELTSEELRRRDEIVFRFAKERGIPIAWSLAGGYQEPIDKVLDIHENTLMACLEACTGDR
jgi:acetoin utilization deacetylase AcuC-like enzyme